MYALVVYDSFGKAWPWQYCTVRSESLDSSLCGTPRYVSIPGPWSPALRVRCVDVFLLVMYTYSSSSSNFGIRRVALPYALCCGTIFLVLDLRSPIVGQGSGWFMLLILRVVSWLIHNDRICDRRLLKITIITICSTKFVLISCCKGCL